MSGGSGTTHTESEEAPTLGLEALDGYFDNLAAAATTEKSLLEELVKSNATLTNTNEDLANIVKRLTGEKKNIQQEVNELRKDLEKTETSREQGRIKEPSHCPHCKRVVWHAPDACYELEKNASKRPAGWRSGL